MRRCATTGVMGWDVSCSDALLPAPLRSNRRRSNTIVARDSVYSTTCNGYRSGTGRSAIDRKGRLDVTGRGREVSRSVVSRRARRGLAVAGDSCCPGRREQLGEHLCRRCAWRFGSGVAPGARQDRTPVSSRAPRRTSRLRTNGVHSARWSISVSSPDGIVRARCLRPATRVLLIGGIDGDDRSVQWRRLRSGDFRLGRVLGCLVASDLDRITALCPGRIEAVTAANAADWNRRTMRCNSHGRN